jgi:hypothetical protein
VAIRFTAMLAMLLGIFLQYPASATLPPEPPPSYAAYGPLRICGNGFSVNLNAGEGVYISGDAVRVMNQDYWFNVDTGASNAAALVRVDVPPLSLSADMAAYRYSDPDSETNRVRYVVDDVLFDGQRHRIVVSSSSFEGADGDKRILNRIGRPSAVAIECIEPELALANAVGTPRADFARQADNELAALYPQSPTPGPAYHCQSGIGFVVELGETILRPWKSMGREWTGPAYVVRDGVAIKLYSPEVDLKKADPDAAMEHPMSLLHKSEITYYPSRGIGPPYSAPGIRDDGSWLVALGAERFRKLEISFPASEKTPVGFRLLERLELVDDNDPRCPHNQ